jgi:hypothetical protein
MLALAVGLLACRSTALGGATPSAGSSLNQVARVNAVLLEDGLGPASRCRPSAVSSQSRGRRLALSDGARESRAIAPSGTDAARILILPWGEPRRARPALTGAVAAGLGGRACC